MFQTEKQQNRFRQRVRHAKYGKAPAKKGEGKQAKIKKGTK